MDGFNSAPTCGPNPYGPICDIALNLLDDMFQGIYNEKKTHESDISDVLVRAKTVGCNRFIVTCGCIEDCVKSSALLEQLRPSFELYTTAGVHPTRSGVFATDPEGAIADLKNFIEDGIRAGTVIAIGECGLDYDRLHFCEADVQKLSFNMQLDLADFYGLPVLLHDRNTSGDFLDVIQRNVGKLRRGGVVHSFTGTLEEMKAYTDLGLYIGVNGCSLKTDENLAIVAQIPLDRLLLETDAPWCGVKNTHASKSLLKTNFVCKKKERFASGEMIKDRCEPCHIINVLEVVAALKSIEPQALAAYVHANTNALFFDYA